MIWEPTASRTPVTNPTQKQTQKSHELQGRPHAQTLTISTQMHVHVKKKPSALSIVRKFFLISRSRIPSNLVSASRRQAMMPSSCTILAAIVSLTQMMTLSPKPTPSSIELKMRTNAQIPTILMPGHALANQINATLIVPLSSQTHQFKIHSRPVNALHKKAMMLSLITISAKIALRTH